MITSAAADRPSACWENTEGDNLFGIPGKYFGEMNSLYVHDVGTDDLGPTAKA